MCSDQLLGFCTTAPKKHHVTRAHIPRLDLPRFPPTSRESLRSTGMPFSSTRHRTSPCAPPSHAQWMGASSPAPPRQHHITSSHTTSHLSRTIKTPPRRALHPPARPLLLHHHHTSLVLLSPHHLILAVRSHTLLLHQPSHQPLHLFGLSPGAVSKLRLDRGLSRSP